MFVLGLTISWLIVRVELSEGLNIVTSTTCLPFLNSNESMIGLGNCYDLYYLRLGIGTPVQYLDVQLDTGSNLLWVPMKEELGHGFSGKDSDTYNPSEERDKIEYADGSEAEGVLGEDVISVDGTMIAGQVSRILFVKEEVDMGFPGSIQGIVGMGYTSEPNFLDLAYASGQITTSAFSLQLRNVSQFSKLFYDKIPPSILSNSTFVEVYGSGFWQLELIGIFVGYHDWTDNAAEVAVIDSGTTLFYLNQQLYLLFQQEYMQGCYLQNGAYMCQCEQFGRMPRFVFMFKGVQVYIQPELYFLEVEDDDGECKGRVDVFGDEADRILLGDTLFQAYTITFDKANAQIGFKGPSQPIGIFGHQYFILAHFVLVVVVIMLFLFMFSTIFLLKPSQIYRKHENDQSRIQSRKTM